MSTVFIAGFAIPLPSRFVDGEIASDNAIAVLNDIQHKRVKAKLRYMLDRGQIDANGLQSKADELMAADLAPYAMLDDDEGADDDPVAIEALGIARDLIISRMAKEGLPPPRGIDLHARALVDSMPVIYERARQRIETRLKVAAAAITEAV